MVDTLVHSSSTHMLAGEGSNIVDISVFSFIERKERSRDIRGTGVDRGVLLLEGEEHGELPGRGDTGDHGVVMGGLGGNDLQEGDLGDEKLSELDGVVVIWSSQLHIANLR